MDKFELSFYAEKVSYIHCNQNPLDETPNRQIPLK